VNIIRFLGLLRLKHTLHCLIPICLAVAPGCAKKRDSQDVDAEPIRPVLSIMAGQLESQSEGYSGIVEARYSASLSFRMLGRIIERQAHLGDAVRKGQLLAKLDMAEMLVAVQSAEAAQAIANVESENADKTLQRQSALLNRNATSQADYDSVKSAAESAKSKVVQSQSDLDKSRDQLDFTDLKADMDGVITNVYAEKGETVQAGKVVFSIANPDDREAVIDVAEEIVGVMKVGSEFRVTVPPLDYQCIGKVREIAPQADAKTRTRRIKLTLESPSEAFRLGTTIKAFPQFSLSSQISLPSTAILDTEGRSFVWVVDEQNKRVRRVQVNIAARMNDQVTIESGIRLGDRVVVAGVHSLTDEQPIRVHQGFDW
jgi:membrane fusion protein, multidrug efflux system